MRHDVDQVMLSRSKQETSFNNRLLPLTMDGQCQLMLIFAYVAFSVEIGTLLSRFFPQELQETQIRESDIWNRPSNGRSTDELATLHGAVSQEGPADAILAIKDYHHH